MTTHGKGRIGSFQWSAEDEQKPERAIVLVPEFDEPNPRTREGRVEEAIGLANAISLDVIETGVIPIRTPAPATLIGKGKVEEIAGVIKASDIGLAIVDGVVSPKQQQNLEKAWNCKVLDRTGLILEIFGERAQTKEGRLQVELAHLNYQKGRLVRSWTHLERQRGGLGFVGGPGETQIEADRRMIQVRIKSLENDLDKVRRTRTLHRAKRKKVPYPVVALVGYTNAGKSTLFNRLTGAKVMAEDLLFATLDPTLRQLVLPDATNIILSDTVGFVSNLPTHLVASFRATLEEVVEAELILHVRDMSHDDRDVQAENVYEILSDLGIDESDNRKVVEVWNKIDRLSSEEKEALTMRAQGLTENKPVLISAISGEGIEDFLQVVEENITSNERVLDIVIPVQEMGILPDVYAITKVIQRTDNEDGSVSMRIRLGKDHLSRFSALESIPAEGKIVR